MKARRSLHIKNLTPRKNSVYKQDYYVVKNPEKYIGPLDKCIYRSSWEYKFMVHCDSAERIVKWSSEPMEIEYFHPIKQEIKNYNVDFYIKVENELGSFKEYIVEVKPFKQLSPPEKPKKPTAKSLHTYNETLKIYLINYSKFTAAKNWAESKDWEFVVVTENFIF